MKKTNSLFLTLLLVAISFGAMAATTILRNGVELLTVERTELDAAVQTSPQLTQAQKATAPQKSSAVQKAPAITDIAGYYYTTDYGTATPTAIVRKYMAQVTQLSGDTVAVTNLLGAGSTVKGVYNATTGVISIAPQIVYTHSTYGDFYCCPVDWENRRYYPNNPIELTIDSDGNFSLGSWGAFVLSGSHAGTQIVSLKTLFYKANAMITDNSLTHASDSLATRTYPACFARESNSQIAIRNFYNTGSEITMTVDSTGVISMPRQILATSGNYNFYNYKITSYTSASDAKWSTAATPGSWTDSVISLDAWAMARTTTTAGLSELLTGTTIKVPQAFKAYSNALPLSGAGTEANPYLISTLADVEALANTTNHNASYLSGTDVFTGVYFKVTNDIDMNDIANHEPIGLEKLAFNGIVDGGNYTISNLKQNRRTDVCGGLFGYTGENAVIKDLKISKPYIESTKTKVGTVVGENHGTISNVTVTNATITNPSMYAGGIAALNYGTISDVSFSGSIEGATYIGGVVGINYNVLSNAQSDASVTLTDDGGYAGGIAGVVTRATATVDNVAFTGTVTDNFGAGQIGGIAGYVFLSSINHAWNGGTVTSGLTSAHAGKVGGLVGRQIGGATNNSYNSGIVRCFYSSYVGGIVGQAVKGAAGTVNASDAPIFNGNLMTGNVFAAPSVTENELFGNVDGEVSVTKSYFDNQACYNGSADNGLSTAELTSGSAIDGFDASAWTFTAGQYPQLTSNVNITKARLDAIPFTLAAGETVKRVKTAFTIGSGNDVKWTLLNGGTLGATGHGLSISGNNVAVTATTVASDTLAATLGSALRFYIIKVVPDEFDGTGTDTDPYLIKSYADIQKLQNAVDVQLYNYEGVYFKVANDIDLSNVTDFYGFSIHGSNYAFKGNIDGNGYAIKNWTANRSLKNGEVVSGAESSPVSFVTYNAGVIKNLTIDSTCTLVGGSYVAAISSANYGTVQNCRNYANITAINTGAAGIVSENYADAKVVSCYNSGAITTGKTRAGGIVTDNAGTVTESQNDGFIKAAIVSSYNADTTALTFVGGVAAYNSGTLTNSLNNGATEATSTVGGLIGANSTSTTVTGNIVTGPVAYTDKKTSGALFGTYNTKVDSVAGNYYDVQLVAESDGNAQTIDGVNGITTTALTSGESQEGLATDVWTFTKNSYPAIKAFASEEASKFNTQAYVALATGTKNDTRFMVSSQGTLSIPSGATATLAKGTVFTIDGTSLKIGSVSESATDTLTIANGKYSKVITLFAAPKMLPNGDGTAENPWRITSVADWNTVATYAANYSASFEDEYFLLENDLNFQGDSTLFNMFESDGATSFQGQFDGNGKTIDGVVYYNEDSKVGVDKGLFGIVGAKGVVKDLTLGANSTIQGYQRVGGFAGSAAGTFINCVNKATVSTLKMGYAGGIVGYANAGANFSKCSNTGTITSANGQGGGIVGFTTDDCSIDSCQNDGSVNGKYSVGGIAGSAIATITNCVNNGTVISTSYNAAGIVGYKDGTTEVRNCKNYGSIATTTYAAGGIVGTLQKAGVVVNCYNEGNVESTTYSAGGIVGVSSGAGAKVDSCQNNGSVAATTYYAGGIVGRLAATSVDSSIVSNSVNYGKISATKYDAGGIVGIATAYTQINNSTNYGEIVADYYAAGIAANVAGNVTGCFNAGSVKGRYTLGGISALGAAVIKECGNVGDITSTATTAATAYNVGGISGTGKATIADVYNAGKVTGYKQVGGIIGLPVKGTATAFGTNVKRAYNIGEVVYDASNAATCGNGQGGATLTYTSYDSVLVDSQAGLPTFANDDSVTYVNTKALVATDFGNNWTKTAGCYPIPTKLASNPVARLYSVALCIDSTETRDSVVTNFIVGVPDSVKWTVSDNLILDEAGNVTLANKTAGETATLTATYGDYTVVYTIKLPNVTTGVDGINVDKPILRVEYVTVGGIVVAEPVQGVNIERTIYIDGTTSTRKFLKK